MQISDNERYTARRDVLKMFEASVETLSRELSIRHPEYWNDRNLSERYGDVYDDVHTLCLSEKTARSAAAIYRAWQTTGIIFLRLTHAWGFNADAVSAGIVWHMLIEQTASHTRRYGHPPARLDKMLDDAIEHGKFLHKQY
ncbi:hypothetical protein [Stappia phage SI01]|uniref:Uncharacterized protein n=1 Tax=Stappia phage SI01 TaxID=2847766 RepID=A0AAE7SPY2_9CAUD|nr:hypothetical protein [Stappia phage SI01]